MFVSCIQMVELSCRCFFEEVAEEWLEKKSGSKSQIIAYVRFPRDGAKNMMIATTPWVQKVN